MKTKPVGPADPCVDPRQHREPPAPRPARASVLLVDDQPARLLTYEAVLAGLEIQCVRALSGTEALHHLLNQEFAAILLDVQMPEIDGFELAKMIREHPRLERTPIIFVTGVHMSEFDRLRGYEVGAIDYIAVPVVPEILRSKVAVLVELHLKRQELQALNRELAQMHARVAQEHQRALSEKESELAAERQRTATAMQANDRYDQALIEDAPVAIMHCALDGKFERVNRALCHMLGYTREELLALRWQDITHAEDRERDASLARQVLEGALPHYTMQKRYLRKDGSIVWVNLFGNFLRDEAGHPSQGVAIAIDITDQIRSLQAVRDSEERLHLITDQLPILISYVDSSRHYQFCNARYCEWFGGEKSTFIGKHVSTVLGDASYRERKPLIDRAMGGELVAFEGPVHHRTLGLRHCDIAYVPHRVSDGRIAGVYVMAHDITERKRAAELVRESERRFRHMADNSPVMIWMTEPDGSCSYLNRRWYEFTGQTPRAGGALDWLDAVHAGDRDRIHDEFMRGNAARVALRLEYRLRDASGCYRWVMDTAAPRFSESGTFSGYIGSVIDISERKSVEDAIRHSEARFRELADAMPQIVFTARADGVTDYFNRQWYEMTGLPRGSTADDVWSRGLHPDDRERTLQRWYESVKSGEPYQIEYRFDFPKHGGYRWHLARALPVRNAAGEIIRWYGTCTDIHALRLAQEALTQADRRKDEFLATLAHELRNPLAPIRSAIQFLQQQSPSDARLARAGSIIDRQTQVMVRLVDDLLDLSRITRGRIALQRAPMNLNEALTSAIDASRPMIEAQGHELRVSTPPQPVMLNADATRLAQLFANLLNNAAKYTPAGGRIEVTVSELGEEVLVSVKDNGIGIPSDMLVAIFEMFTQVESSLDRTHGGLGIGLTLARQLAELHGGRIEARSSGAGAGSEFLVTLPIATTIGAIASTPLLARVERGSRRVLIADDNIDAAQMLRYLLEMSDYEVHTASDGREAVQAYQACRPDVLLLDIGMPEMNGYEVARAIRSLPDGKDVLIVAITGWGQENDRKASTEAGFDAHLTKPVDFDTLQALIEAGVKQS